MIIISHISNIHSQSCQKSVPEILRVLRVAFFLRLIQTHTTAQQTKQTNITFSPMRLKNIIFDVLFTLTLPISLPLYLLWWSNILWHSDPMTAKPEFFHNYNLVNEGNRESEEEEDTKNRILVVGAGFSGLGTCAALRRHGIAFDCVERTGKIGGNWAHGVYETVHIISSRKTTEFKDWPMPADFPDFPSAKQMRRYLNDYADHWNFRRDIMFDTEALSVQCFEDEQGDTKWRVVLRKYDAQKQDSYIDEERVYGGICLCNGHHWDCRMPEYDQMEKFSGEIIHSKAYKHPDQLRGKHVLVIGGGNSACDIAVEAARFAESSDISMRRGYHFLPRSVFGIPLVEIVRPWYPMWMQRVILSILVRIIVGDYSKYGLHEPDHAIFERHPTINSELVQFIKLGKIKPQRDIIHFVGDKTIEFADGTRKDYDLVVCCTGYYASIPLLDQYIEKESETQYPHLISGTFVPGIRNVYNVGLGQARYGAGPLYNVQGELVSKCILMQPKLKHPIGDILRSFGAPMSSTSKKTSDELIDPHQAWKTATLASKIVVPLLPKLEVIATLLGFLPRK